MSEERLDAKGGTVRGGEADGPDCSALATAWSADSRAIADARAMRRPPGVNSIRQMEIDPNESQTRLRAMLDSMQGFVGLLSPDGTVLEANVAALAYAGVTLDAVRGKPLWDGPWWRHSAAERERLRCAVQEAALGRVCRFESSHVNATGVVDDVDFALAPVLDGGGRVIYLVPEGRPFTGYKREQLRLEASNADLWGALHDRTAQLDASVQEMRTNGRHMQAIMGSATEGIIRMDEAEVKACEQALARTRDQMDRVVADLKARSRELQTAQQDLQEQGRLNREILDSVNEGIVVYDRDLVCVARNRFMAELTGIPNHQVIGRCIKTQFPDLAPHGIWQALERVLAGETVTVDHPLGRRLGGRQFLAPGADKARLSDPDIVWTWPVYHPRRNNLGEVVGVILTVSDGTARKHAEDHARDQHERVRALARQLDATVEQERRHLARELHDELAQLLTALRIDIGWVKRKLTAGQTVLMERADAMERMVGRIQDALRRIAASLRPAILDQRGLAPAIAQLTEEFARTAQVPCRFNRRPEEPQVPDPQSTVLYRITQEALTNVARHAQARQVSVDLEVTASHYALTIADDGQGFSPEQRRKPRSFGLVGMQERVAALGGTLEIISVPGDGTRIEVLLPCNAEPS